MQHNALQKSLWQLRDSLQDYYGLELDNGFSKSVAFHTEVNARNESVAARMSEDIFSRMVYQNICPGEDVQHLRNVSCNRPG